MTDTNDGIVALGIDWADPHRPVLRTAAPGAATADVRPLVAPLCYRVLDPDVRYCTGPEPTHVVCATWEQIPKGTQCSTCQYNEGFITAHHAHRRSASLPDNVRDYLAQQHWLYLDIFADGTTKVGTVAHSRLPARLAEQGAVAARYVARATNGTIIRALEDAVSTRLELTQSISEPSKLNALTRPVDTAQLDDKIDAFAHTALTQLRDLAADIEGTEILDEPTRWNLPETSTDAFAATPIALYRDKVGVGEHSLHLQAATGRIGVFTLTDDPADLVYAATLTGLRGRHIALGDYQSSTRPLQDSLF